ncbi:MAG: hypothetical protein ABI934_05005 [Actinomycetota bacterium]
MTMSTWMVLGVICLLYVAFGIWAVSQIFPRAPAATPRSDLDQNAPIVGQDAPISGRSTKARTVP